MNCFCLENLDDLEFIKESFNILSEPNRIKILCILWKNEKLCVCEIEKVLNLKQNLVSHHLWVFKRIWLLKQERIWTSIYYSINPETYTKLKNLVWTIFNFKFFYLWKL
jgi:ArsR family transcriptional regulator